MTAEQPQKKLYRTRRDHTVEGLVMPEPNGAQG